MIEQRFAKHWGNAAMANVEKLLSWRHILLQWNGFVIKWITAVRNFSGSGLIIRQTYNF